MNKYMTKRKMFNIFEYDKEEAFLRENHKKGYAFLSVSLLSKYKFEKVKAEDYIYKLEYQREGDEENESKKLMEDYGWEYVGNFFQYNYYRKKASYDASDEIYTDESAKNENLRRIFLSRVLPIAIIFGIIVFPGFIEGLRDLYTGDGGGIWFVISLVMFLLYCYIFIDLISNYLRITKNNS